MTKGRSMKHFIAYLRVSTDKQGEQGHGIHAQRQAIENYIRGHLGELLEEFVEVESGKKNDRPALQAAMNRCKVSRATLVIAKLDRLSRNLAFIANLMDAGIDFVACDNPYANKLTLHILAAIAEHEREMISRRTKEALAAAKARGVKLGGCRGTTVTDEIRRQAVETRQKKARGYAARVSPVIQEFLDTGHSLNGTAKALNRRQILTARGCSWTAKAVSRILDMAGDHGQQ